MLIPRKFRSVDFNLPCIEVHEITPSTELAVGEIGGTWTSNLGEFSTHK